MRSLEPGMFARSIAGHDKGTLYVVCAAAGEMLLLADGRHRTASAPKKKKRKHVQPDYTIAETLKICFAEGRIPRDEDIRKAIREKNREEIGCQKLM